MHLRMLRGDDRQPKLVEVQKAARKLRAQRPEEAISTRERSQWGHRKGNPGGERAEIATAANRSHSGRTDSGRHCEEGQHEWTTAPRPRLLEAKPVDGNHECRHAESKTVLSMCAPVAGAAERHVARSSPARMTATAIPAACRRSRAGSGRGGVPLKLAGSTKATDTFRRERARWISRSTSAGSSRAVTTASSSARAAGPSSSPSRRATGVSPSARRLRVARARAASPPRVNAHAGLRAARS